MKNEIANFKSALEQSDILNLLNNFNIIIESITDCIKSKEATNTADLNSILEIENNLIFECRKLYSILKDLTYDKIKESENEIKENMENIENIIGELKLKLN